MRRGARPTLGVAGISLLAPSVAAAHSEGGIPLPVMRDSPHQRPRDANSRMYDDAIDPEWFWGHTLTT